MAKVILFVLMCAALIGLGNCAPFFWNSSAVSYGEFGTAANWQNGSAPGNGDCAYITPDPGNPGKAITVVISAASATISNITFLAPGNLIVTGTTTFTVSNDLRVASAIKIRVDSGATLNIGGHFDFANNGLTFSLYGTVTTAAIKSNSGPANGFPNDGPSSILVTAANNQLNVIDSSFTTTANTFVFAPAAVHTFYSTNAGASNTITFANAPTFTQFLIKNDYFNPAPVNFVFQQGANFIGNPTSGSPILSTNTTGLKGATTFKGTFSCSLATTNIDSQPTFTGTNVVINGGVLTFTLYDGAFTGSPGALTLLGTGGVSFISNGGSQVGRTITVTNTVNVYVPTFSFTRDTVPAFWTFANGGNGALNFYNAYTIPTVYVYNVPATFFVPVTVQGNGAMIRAGATITFWDGVITSGGTQVWNFSPSLKCNTNAFNFSGAFTFTNGFTIFGCDINAGTSQINVGNSITVAANSTIDLTQVTLNYTNPFGGSNPTFTFSGSGNPPNSLYSLGLKNFPTAALGGNLVLTADTVDVIINNTLSLSAGSMANPTQLLGSGQFTLNGGLNVADFVTISATVAFPSGNVVIGSNSQTRPATWGGNLLLRNSVVTGTGSVNFQGSISVLNGNSNINTNSFILNAALTVNYLANYTSGTPNFLENPTLIFNAGAQRTLQFGVTAGSKVNVVFSDALSLSPTTPPGLGVTFTSTATGSAITFNQSPTITIALNGLLTDTYTVNGNTFFNSSNVRISNNGIFNINGNVTTQGAINNPGLPSDAVVNLNNNLFIVAVANTIFGPSATIVGTFTTDDNDRNTSTALTTVTFNSTSGTLEAIPGGLYTFFTNVTFLGSTFIKATTVFSGNVGFLQFNGNCFLIGASVTVNMRTIFNTAINISANSNNQGFSVTFNPATLPANNGDGLWFNGNALINIGITLTLNQNLNVYFLTPLTVFGTGAVTATGVNFIGNGPVTISPLIVTLNSGAGNANPVTFLGSGNTQYTISPFNSQFNLGAVIVANVPVTYVGALVTLTTNNPTPTIPTAWSFFNSTVTFTSNGGNTLIFSGTRTLATNNAFVFNNLNTVTFQSTVTINNPTPFSVTGTTQATLVFLYDIVLGQATTIALNVNFGQSTNFNSLTVSGNTLTLTGLTINVFNNIVFANNGAIVSNRPGSNLQTVTGTTASFSNSWSFNTPVNFGGVFNFTSTMTFTQNHVLLGGSNLNFPQGINFASPATALSGSGRICIFGFLNNTNAATVSLAPGLDISTVASPFSVVGAFIVNSTFTCRGQTTFSNNIIFGFANTLGTANPLNLNDNCQWTGTGVTATLFRTTINTNNANGVSIFIPVVIACLNGTGATTVTFTNGAQLSFFADVTVSTVNVDFNNARFGAVNIITTVNRALVQNVVPTTVLTFNSVPTNAEPIVSFGGGALTQPINILAPIQVNQITFGPSSQAYSTNGQGRLDLGDSITVTSTVMISVQTNLFLTTNTTATQPYAVTLSSGSTTFTLNNLTLNSPFGFPAPAFTFTSAANSIIRFATSGTLNFGRVTIVGPGTTSFRTGTFNVVGTLLVQPAATFWQDLATVTTNNVTFAPPATSTSQPSIYQVTLTSATPPTLSTTFAVYGGSGQVLLSNFAPSGTTTAPVIVVNNGAAFGNVLSPVTGTPGYSYSSVRSGNGNNGLSFVVNQNTPPTNSPTQSNGPAPPVSGASTQFFSFVALLISFAIVFISLC